MNTRTETQVGERLLPCALDAERWILGSALAGDHVEIIRASLSVEDFTTEAHRRIFAAVQTLAERGCRIETGTVFYELMRCGQHESVGGLTYLISLDESLPRIVTLLPYIEVVKDNTLKRRIIETAQSALCDSFAQTDTGSAILDRLKRGVEGLSEYGRKDWLLTPSEIVQQQGLETLLSSGKKDGLESPWPTLNRLLFGGGLNRGQLIVVGARPSVGKTALACQLAAHIASCGVATTFFSLEMPAAQIVRRIAATSLGIDTLKISQQRGTESEVADYAAALNRLDELRSLKIADNPRVTIETMRTAIEGSKDEPRLVIVDYLQLVEPSGTRNRPRYEQVTDISRALKQWARDSGLILVVLAQLNRETEKAGREPKLSDLRDSGAIEQDGDLILLLARKEGQDEATPSQSVDLIIAKQRNGPLGKVCLEFQRSCTKFAEVSKRQINE